LVVFKIITFEKRKQAVSAKYFINSYEILMRCFISVYELLNNVVDHELIFGFSKMIDRWFLD